VFREYGGVNAASQVAQFTETASELLAGSGQRRPGGPGITVELPVQRRTRPLGARLDLLLRRWSALAHRPTVPSAGAPATAAALPPFRAR